MLVIYIGGSWWLFPPSLPLLLAFPPSLPPSLPFLPFLSFQSTTCRRQKTTPPPYPLPPLSRLPSPEHLLHRKAKNHLKNEKKNEDAQRRRRKKKIQACFASVINIIVLKYEILLMKKYNNIKLIFTSERCAWRRLYNRVSRRSPATVDVYTAFISRLYHGYDRHFAP